MCGVAMPRYFFHLRDQSGKLLDIEGSEHRDVETATAAAVRQAREMIVDDVRHRGELPLGDRIEITDASGLVIATVSFADSITIAPDSTS